MKQRQCEEDVVEAVDCGEEENLVPYPLFRGQFRPGLTHQTVVKSAGVKDVLVRGQPEVSPGVTFFRDRPHLFSKMVDVHSEDLADLLSRSESSELDFKSGELLTNPGHENRKKIAQNLVGFANRNGGKLVIGVDDNTREPEGASIREEGATGIISEISRDDCSQQSVSPTSSTARKGRSL